jgi:hypothetical protein
VDVRREQGFCYGRFDVPKARKEARLSILPNLDSFLVSSVVEDAYGAPFTAVSERATGSGFRFVLLSAAKIRLIVE